MQRSKPRRKDSRAETRRGGGAGRKKNKEKPPRSTRNQRAAQCGANRLNGQIGTFRNTPKAITRYTIPHRHPAGTQRGRGQRATLPFHDAIEFRTTTSSNTGNAHMENAFNRSAAATLPCNSW